VYLNKKQGDNIPSANIPGERIEPLIESSGAALAVYTGHSISTPIWSVAFSPSGYYFASAGFDSTARLWCTDRPKPVRIFVGHCSPSINSITWHHNCNYVLTGADDKTVRMWDVQTGRCVRLLTGCRAGVNLVRVCPSGRYVAGADYFGVVNIWDLGTGRKVSELCHNNLSSFTSSPSTPTIVRTGINQDDYIIHSMSYSVCGTSLATSGDNFSVYLWDARGLGSHVYKQNLTNSIVLGDEMMHINDDLNSHQSTGTKHHFYLRKPAKTFRTRRTMVLDLEYTKRNLLLSVGKYIPPC